MLVVLIRPIEYGPVNADDLNEQFWTNRYNEGKMGWDMGRVSPPLSAYIDQLEDTSLEVLIPGAGNAYEAEYFMDKGFTSVYVNDISAAAIESFKKRVSKFPEEYLLHADFFDLDMKFDLVIEQTFFCALHPSLRKQYVEKMVELIRPGGRLVGLLFDAPMNTEHPPYGGYREEYEQYFRPAFNFLTFDACHNSHPARQGSELFMILERK